MEFQYGVVERALASSFDVPEAGLGAFRARLRHLRNKGVPTIERVGSGARANYGLEHLWQLVIALELESFGMPPSAVAALVLEEWTKEFRRCLPEFCQRAWREPRWLLILRPNLIEERLAGWGPMVRPHLPETGPLSLITADQLPELMEKNGERFAVINLSAAFSALRSALEGIGVRIP